MSYITYHEQKQEQEKSANNVARYSDDMPSWYIDAKELWRMLIERRERNKKIGCMQVNAGINQAVCLMNSLPAADVVEVVRCKDCKHYDEHFCKCYVFCHDNIEVQLEVDSDHFCSYGERRVR